MRSIDLPQNNRVQAYFLPKVQNAKKLKNTTRIYKPTRHKFSSWSRLTSDGGLLKFIKLALDKSKHKAGLPHCHIPQQHQFELADLGLGQAPIRSTIPTGAHDGGKEDLRGGGAANLNPSSLLVSCSPLLFAPKMEWKIKFNLKWHCLALVPQPIFCQQKCS